ncbi:MAG: NifB/NifX family molybdenum-iron cluster-binding protein [Elusimicrobiota bacterium]
MKIAVSSKGAGLGAWMEPNLAKCGFLMIVDKGRDFKAIENKLDEITLAKTAIAEGVDALIAGKIDEPTRNLLRQNGIQIYKAQNGSVWELIDQLSEGKLSIMD